MINIELECYEIEITAVDQKNANAPILTAAIQAYSNSGGGHGTGVLPMYDKGSGRPKRHVLSADLKNPETAKWLIRAFNVDAAGGSLFYAEHLLDITKDQVIKLVIVNKLP